MQLNNKERAQWGLVVLLGIACLICLMSLLSGCSSLPLAKQKKLAVIMYEDALLIGQTAKDMCLQGVLKEEDCEKIGQIYDLFIDADVMYAQALDEYEKNQDSPYHLARLNAARTRANGALANLISKAIELGVNWKED